MHTWCSDRDNARDARSPPADASRHVQDMQVQVTHASGAGPPPRTAAPSPVET